MGLVTWITVKGFHWTVDWDALAGVRAMRKLPR
jgi:hypothetical protein